MTLARAVRGAATAAVFAFAALVVCLAFGGTVEMESFPVPRDNHAPVVVGMLVFAVLVTGGEVALAGRRSCTAWTVTAALVALMGLRMWTLTPVLHCWSYDSVSRDGDGAYRCPNRGDMLP